MDGRKTKWREGGGGMLFLCSVFRTDGAAPHRLLGQQDVMKDVCVRRGRGAKMS